MKLRFLPLLILGLLPLAAESGGSVESSMFLPPEFFVGDIVELRMVIVPDEGARLSIPQQLPEPFWMKIRSLNLKEMSNGSYELRLIFSSFYPGTRTMPPIILGDVILDKIKLHTQSILDEKENSLAEIRGPMLLPGTIWIISVLIVLVLVGPLLLIFSVSFIRSKSIEFIRTIQLRLPYRRFHRLIRELNANFFNTSDRDFYFALSDGLRSYLTNRTGEDFLTVTLEEIGNLLPKYLPVFEDQKQLVKLLHYADLIKFSGGGSVLEKKRRDLDDSFDLIRSIENHYKSKEKKTGEREDADP